jgi:HD-like signal output (HDOD) protein
MQLVPTISPGSDMTVFEQTVDQLETCAPAPVVVQRVLALLSDGTSSWRELEHALAVDAGLVARILRLASTPAFVARPVRDLRFALQALGGDQLRRIVVAAQFAGQGSAFNRALWSYSLKVALVCDALGAIVKAPKGPDPFLCGLLHDLGTMVLEKVMGRTYPALGFAPGDEQQVAIEQAAFGFDHADLGAMMASRWNLFPELELVAQLHHTPSVCESIEVPPATRAAIELVALARAVGRPDGAPAAAPREVLAARLGLEVPAAEEAARAAHAKASELIASLG